MLAFLIQLSPPKFLKGRTLCVCGQIIGCRSLCKGLDQGWVGYFIDNAKGDANLVSECAPSVFFESQASISKVHRGVWELQQINPLITLPSGKRIRWAQQFLQVSPI